MTFFLNQMRALSCNLNMWTVSKIKDPFFLILILLLILEEGFSLTHIGLQPGDMKKQTKNKLIIIGLS